MKRALDEVVAHAASPPLSRRLVLLAMLVIATIHQPALASTQEGSDAAPLPFAPELNELPYEGLRSAWREVRSDLDRQAWLEATGRTGYLVDVRTNLGLANVPELSFALLHAAGEASRAGAPDAAEELSDAAAVLSPDLATPHFAKARHRFDVDPFAIQQGIRELKLGLEHLNTDLGAYLIALGNFWTLSFYLFVLLLSLVSCSLLMRYLPFASKDLRRLLPRGVTQLQAQTLLVVALMLPLASGLGLTLTLLIILATVSPYLRGTERFLAVCLATCAVLTPYGTSQVVRAINFPAHPASIVDACQRGLCTQEQLTQLSTMSDEGLAYEAAFTEALVTIRRSNGEAAVLDRARSLALRASELSPTAEVDVLLGNVSYLRALKHCPRAKREPSAAAKVQIEKGQQEALEHWRRALSKDNRNLPALYNSSAILSQLGEHASADPLLGRAMTIDQDEVIRWNRSVTRQGNNLIRCKLATAVNRNVMEPRLRQSLLRSHVLEASVPNRDVVLPFSGFITGRYATHAIGLGGLILGLFMVLIWLAERVIRPCKPCISCGSPAATQTRLDTEDGPVCQTCLLLEIRRAFVDAKEQWFREQQRENERKRRRARARYISWFLPGVGHFLSGAPLRGALFSLMVIGGIIGGLELNIIITHPSAPLGPSSAKVAGCAVLGVGGWILAVLDAHTGGTGA